MERERNPNSPTHNCRKLKALVNDEFFNFPDEIIAEILCRLPVKSVGRFRCVSKSWLSLTSSKQFIKTHLNFSKDDTNADGYRVLLTIEPEHCLNDCTEIEPEFGLKQCSVRSLMHEEILDDVSNIDYPMKHPDKTVTVVGCCNGLICIAIGETNLILWNPATKDSTKLPALRMEMKPGCSTTINGFAFTESSDDYKVVRIICFHIVGSELESIANIYSSKTDSWKKVEDYKGKDPMTYPGKFANGKLHWLTEIDSQDLESGLDWGIFSLDLESELYGTLDQPNYGEGKFKSNMGVLGGCICILCNYEKTHVGLWVLKEYGVKESWTKVFHFPHVYNFAEFMESRPLCILPNGEILLVIEASFVVYNPIYNSFRLCERMDLDSYVEADIYVESLVSPAANGRLHRQHQRGMKKLQTRYAHKACEGYR